MAVASTKIALASFFHPEARVWATKSTFEKLVLRKGELRPVVRIYYFMALEVQKAGLVEFTNFQSLSLTGVRALIPGPSVKDFCRLQF